MQFEINTNFLVVSFFYLMLTVSHPVLQMVLKYHGNLQAIVENEQEILFTSLGGVVI